VSSVHTKITINAPDERVWETVLDPNRLKDWVTIHRSVSNASPEPLRKGSTMDQVLHMRGVSFHVHWTVVDIRPPHYVEWEGRGPAHSKARIRYELRSEGDDVTEFEYTNEFSTPGGRLGSMASRFVVGAAAEREARASLERLKTLLEWS
jgi:carbon monoxide dehydrogenase subunit G